MYQTYAPLTRVTAHDCDIIKSTVGCDVRSVDDASYHQVDEIIYQPSAAGPVYWVKMAAAWNPEITSNSYTCPCKGSSWVTHQGSLSSSCSCTRVCEPTIHAGAGQLDILHRAAGYDGEHVQSRAAVLLEQCPAARAATSNHICQLANSHAVRYRQTHHSRMRVDTVHVWIMAQMELYCNLILPHGALATVACTLM
jgi:hypothetical protein